jgi:hypothetical protein
MGDLKHCATSSSSSSKMMLAVDQILHCMTKIGTLSGGAQAASRVLQQSASWTALRLPQRNLTGLLMIQVGRPCVHITWCIALSVRHVPLLGS